MGLFDYVVPECQLPDAGAKEVAEWQTKTFDCPYMERYKITREGRLLAEVVRYEDHSNKTAQGIRALIGIMTPVHEGWKDTNFHGILNFYGAKDWSAASEWYEYDAKFTDGALVAITRVTESRRAG